MKKTSSQRAAVLILSLGAVVYMLMDNRARSQAAYYWTIPLFFGILYFLCFRIAAYSRNYLGMLVFNLSLVIRYVATPVFVVWRRHVSNFSYTPTEANTAVLLMIYEMIAVMIFVQILSPKFFREKKPAASGDPSPRSLILLNIAFPLVFVAGTALLVARNWQTALSVFSFIFTSSTVNIVVLSRAESLPLEYELVVCVQLAMIFLCGIGFQHFYKKMKSRGFLRNVELAALIGLIILTSSLILYSSRTSVLFPLITGLFLMMYLFREKKKKIAVIGFGLVLLLLAGLSYRKQFRFESASELVTQKDVVISETPNILTQYFAGLPNVAGAIRTKSYFKYQFSFSGFAKDILSRIVIIGRSFRQDFNASRRYNYVLAGNDYGSWILPMIGMGYLYFGFIFSPILSMLAALLFMWFDSKARQADNVFSKYLLIYASLKFGLFMTSNALNLADFLFNYFILGMALIGIIKLTTKRSVLSIPNSS